MIEFGRFLGDSITISDGTTHAQIKKVVASLEAGLEKATKTSLIKDAQGNPYFIPPYVAADFPPYTSMISSDGT